MRRGRSLGRLGLEADPFGERSPWAARTSLQLLGGRFGFESNSAKLLRLVQVAYAGLPAQRLPGKAPEFRVRLQLMQESAAHASLTRRFLAHEEPPPIAMLGGAGLLAGATRGSNSVMISPRERSALVAVSPQMLKFPYHARYELIEFAVFTLASRAQGLVPLHAACIGHRGRGLLLVGASGAGKSTLALHALLQGLDFLSEDSAFVAADSMLATGVPNFLHLRADALRWLGDSREAAIIRRSPIIRRRSGAEKFELDLRREPFRLARSPLEIVGIVFLSARGAGAGALLSALPPARARALLERSQGYGARLPQWAPFRRQLSGLQSFEMRRGPHPRDSVDALQALLAAG